MGPEPRRALLNTRIGCELRQAIEANIADTRHSGATEVSELQARVEEASRALDDERAQRAAAEGQLHTMRAEEEQQKAPLSEMLQVLSGEVRAARAEVSSETWPISRLISAN